MMKYGALYSIGTGNFIRLFDADDIDHAREQAKDATESGETLVMVRMIGWRNYCDNEIARQMLTEEEA